MTDTGEAGGRVEQRRRSPKRALVIGAIVVAVALIGYVLAVTTIPRWWAQRVGAMVDGSMTAGLLLGMLFGAVFTALPLLVLWLGVRLRRNWKLSGLCLVVAILLAIPNLATLGIVLGDGDAAHAGERILDVEGPGYRAGTLVGAIVAVLAVGALGYLAFTRRRTRLRGERIRRELDDRGRTPARADGDDAGA